MRIKGTLDEWTFYRDENGGLVRFKGGVSGERIASDPTFARTRANGMEFGHAAKMGKLFRLSIIPMLQSSADGKVTSRLTKVMANVKNLDPSNEHGLRTVATTVWNLKSNPFGCNCKLSEQVLFIFYKNL